MLTPCIRLLTLRQQAPPKRKILSFWMSRMRDSSGVSIPGSQLHIATQPWVPCPVAAVGKVPSKNVCPFLTFCYVALFPLKSWMKQPRYTLLQTKCCSMRTMSSYNQCEKLRFERWPDDGSGKWSNSVLERIDKQHTQFLSSSSKVHTIWLSWGRLVVKWG